MPEAGSPAVKALHDEYWAIIEDMGRQRYLSEEFALAPSASPISASPTEWEFGQEGGGSTTDLGVLYDGLLENLSGQAPKRRAPADRSAAEGAEDSEEIARVQRGRREPFGGDVEPVRAIEAPPTQGRPKRPAGSAATQEEEEEEEEKKRRQPSRDEVEEEELPGGGGDEPEEDIPTPASSPAPPPTAASPVPGPARKARFAGTIKDQQSATPRAASRRDKRAEDNRRAEHYFLKNLLTEKNVKKLNENRLVLCPVGSTFRWPCTQIFREKDTSLRPGVEAFAKPNLHEFIKEIMKGKNVHAGRGGPESPAVAAAAAV